MYCVPIIMKEETNAVYKGFISPANDLISFTPTNHFAIVLTQWQDTRDQRLKTIYRYEY